MQSCRASLRLVLLTALALPALIGDRAAASSPAPALPRPPAVVVPPLHPHPPSVPDPRVFARAAAHTGVPLALLLAISYVQSQWGNHGGRPSIDGGYGLMDLVHNPERDTLDAAARLLGVPPGRVAREDALNVLGGARLLARAARALSAHHRLPRTLGGWAPAVVWLTGMRSRLATEAVLREVYGLLAHGEALGGRPGGADRPIGRLRATPGAVPNVRTLAPLLPLPAARGQGAEYPGAIWAPSPNHTPARQPATGRVRYVVIHDTEGSCAAALNWLDGPASGSSAHFLVCQDGTVYQLAHVRDIAWHAGNAYINRHSIGIEHEGFRDSGGYTPAQYDASAAIVRWLDTVYGLHIPLDRNAIFGHDNVPDGGHTDPGPYWDWNYYMSRVRGGAPYDGGNPSVAIVVAPEALFYDCPNPSCKVEGSADWGEQFALARTAGTWDEVYYNGHAAWVVGTAVTAGAGAPLRVGAAHLPVRDEPRRSGHVMGAIVQGQVYVSRLRAHAPDRDRQGWWLIAYNHRYGFINCSYAQPIGQPLPPDCADPPAVLPGAPALCGATPLSATVTPAAPATEIVEPATTSTSTGTVTPSATMTGTVTPTATATGTASPQAGTATATTTVMDPASPSATGTPTAAATSTATPTPTPTPTATMTPTPRPTPTLSVPPSPTPTATPLQLATLVVSPSRPYAGLDRPLRLCVHTNVGGALVRYRLDLPAGVTLRAGGRTDAWGNVERAFILPGKRWFAEVRRRAARRYTGRKNMPRVPHSLGAGYAVSVTWHGHTLSRQGRFRVVLWGPA